MNAYILEDNTFSNDELAIYVLIESTEYDEGEYYKYIMGVSYDLACIEKMLSEIKAKPETDENAEYYVYRIRQQYEHIHIPDWEIQEPLKDNCYLVYRGPAHEIAENVLGYFGDKQHAIQFAENAMSFFETEDIMIINAPLDRLFELYEVENGSWDEDEWQFIFE